MFIQTTRSLAAEATLDGYSGGKPPHSTCACAEGQGEADGLRRAKGVHDKRETGPPERRLLHNHLDACSAANGEAKPRSDAGRSEQRPYNTTD